MILAKQWAGCMTAALDDCEALERAGAPPVLRFRYEDVMGDPGEVMARVCAHCDLDNPAPVIDHAARSADPARVNKWRAQLDEAAPGRGRPPMAPVLERLGYAWDASGPAENVARAG